MNMDVVVSVPPYASLREALQDPITGR